MVSGYLTQGARGFAMNAKNLHVNGVGSLIMSRKYSFVRSVLENPAKVEDNFVSVLPERIQST